VKTERKGTEKVTTVTREEITAAFGIDLNSTYMVRLKGFPEPEGVEFYYSVTPWDDEDEEESDLNSR
jgi:hypothetical protein